MGPRKRVIGVHILVFCSATLFVFPSQSDSSATQPGQSNLPKFSSSASISVSNVCKREVSAKRFSQLPHQYMIPIDVFLILPDPMLAFARAFLLPLCKGPFESLGFVLG